MIATIATIPIRIDDALAIPFIQCFTATMISKTAAPSSKFSTEPKSFAVLPPPKELTPTAISDNPIDSTTVPVTTAGKNLRSGFNRNPRIPSNRPPMTDAHIMAPYARIPPPIT